LVEGGQYVDELGMKDFLKANERRWSADGVEDQFRAETRTPYLPPLFTFERRLGGVSNIVRKDANINSLVNYFTV
jgi:hypothetical protein